MRTHTGSSGEHALGRLPKRYRNDSLPLGKPLAGAQVEGYAGPAPVIDEAFQGDEGLGIRIAVDAFLRPISRILPADDISRLDWQHAAKDLVLFLADRLWLQGRRRLHRRKPEDLE